MSSRSKAVGKKGSPVWGVNYFRRDALVSLMDDLVEREKEGLADEECQHVQRCLSRLANAAAAIPDHSFWRTTILKEMQGFADIYLKWNSHTGEEAPRKRRLELSNLRKKRNRLASAVRTNQYILENELDLALVESMYQAMGSLAEVLPEIFKNLGGSVSYFNKELEKHK